MAEHRRRVTQAVTRPARTGLQGGLAFAVVELMDSFGWPADFTDRQYGALVVLGTMVVGAVQVAVENRSGWGLLRDVPPRTDPVPGD